MSNIVKLHDEVYTIDEVINDLETGKELIQDIVFVTILKDGTAIVSHTGLPLHHMALSCKLLDKEFDNMVELDITEEIE